MDPVTETKLLSYFHYIPNKPLAIVALIVYIIFGLLLIYITYRSRSQPFLYILPGTAFALALGYLFRLLCLTSVSLFKYILMTFFLLLPPNALALVNYRTMSKVSRLTIAHPPYFFLKPKFLTWFFVSSDIFAFVLQGSGGGLQVVSSMSNIGRYITIVGLAVQLFFFGSFTSITIYIHRHYDVGEKKVVICLYGTIGLIYIRSVYRFVEYLDGYDGSIASAEWALYVFDTLPIALCFIVYSVFFIGHYLPVEDKLIKSESDIEMK